VRFAHTLPVALTLLLSAAAGSSPTPNRSDSRLKCVLAHAHVPFSPGLGAHVQRGQARAAHNTCACTSNPRVSHKNGSGIKSSEPQGKVLPLISARRESKSIHGTFACAHGHYSHPPVRAPGVVVAPPAQQEGLASTRAGSERDDVDVTADPFVPTPRVSLDTLLALRRRARVRSDRIASIDAMSARRSCEDASCSGL